jgi:hypothetical protein
VYIYIYTYTPHASFVLFANPTCMCKLAYTRPLMHAHTGVCVRMHVRARTSLCVVVYVRERECECMCVCDYLVDCMLACILASLLACPLICLLACVRAQEACVVWVYNTHKINPQCVFRPLRFRIFYGLPIPSFIFRVFLSILFSDRVPFFKTNVVSGLLTCFSWVLCLRSPTGLENTHSHEISIVLFIMNIFRTSRDPRVVCGFERIMDVNVDIFKGLSIARLSMTSCTTCRGFS